MILQILSIRAHKLDRTCKYDAMITTLMTSIDSGYDTATILEVLIKTLVQKNVISEQEAKYIKEAGRGATFRQDQTGSEQTG
jgi:transcriptional regulator CtsR